MLLKLLGVRRAIRLGLCKDMMETRVRWLVLRRCLETRLGTRTHLDLEYFIFVCYRFLCTTSKSAAPPHC